MIASPEDAAFFKNKNVARLFNYADTGIVAFSIAADAARILFGDIVAYSAVSGTAFKVQNGLRYPCSLALRHAENGKSETLGALSAYAGQFHECLDRPAEDFARNFSGLRAGFPQLPRL